MALDGGAGRVVPSARGISADCFSRSSQPDGRMHLDEQFLFVADEEYWLFRHSTREYFVEHSVRRSAQGNGTQIGPLVQLLTRLLRGD
jgi:hypothetical protein